MIFPDWQLLTFPNPRALNPTVRQLHQAAQLVAMAGNSLLPKRDDDSQSNLEWLPVSKALAGNLLGNGLRFALLLESLELALLDRDHHFLAHLSLAGKTVEKARQWVQTEASHHGLDGPGIQPIRHFEIPDHPLDSGAPFKLANPLHHQELARYHFNADRVLKYVTPLFSKASEVRIWPHHFDSGAVLTITENEEGAATRTIGIGMAIADADIDELYFYITHWSGEGNPSYENLPALAAGEWKREGWVGPVLRASDLIHRPTAPEQARLVIDFFTSGINGSLQLLGQPRCL